MCKEDKEYSPHYRTCGVRGEVGEILSYVVGVTDEFSGYGGNDVFQCPSGDDGVGSHDDKSCEHSHISHQFPRPSAVGACGVSLCVAAYDKLADHSRYSECGYTTQVYYHECRTSVLSRLIGEAPDVSQSYCRTGGCEDDAYFRCKLTS